MKKLTIYIVLALLCLYFPVSAQHNPSPKGLLPGDVMPDIQLQKLLNYSMSAVRFQTWRGKVVILDFWATWCSNCIEAFARTDSLQKQFPKQLLVIGVAYEPTAKIQAFFNRVTNSSGKTYQFPCVTADTQLSGLFPHRSLPHYVWIGSDGLVKAITGSEELTAANVRNVLESGTLAVPQKADINPDRPLFISDQVITDSLQHYALLYHKAYNGVVTTRRLRETNGVVRGVAVTNQPIMAIYETAFEGIFRQSHQQYFTNRCLIESRNSVALKASIWNADAKPVAQSMLYNYDLLVPVSAADSLYQLMLADLNSSSGYVATLEQRLSNCLVLKRNSEVDKIKSKSGKSVRQMAAGAPLDLQNAPMAVFISWLNTQPAIALPVLDETGYMGKTDLLLPAIHDVQGLNDALRAYDLRLVPERRLLEVFVLRDRHSATINFKPTIPKP